MLCCYTLAMRFDAMRCERGEVWRGDGLKEREKVRIDEGSLGSRRSVGSDRCKQAG